MIKPTLLPLDHVEVVVLLILDVAYNVAVGVQLYLLVYYYYCLHLKKTNCH